LRKNISTSKTSGKRSKERKGGNGERKSITRRGNVRRLAEKKTVTSLPQRGGSRTKKKAKKTTKEEGKYAQQRPERGPQPQRVHTRRKNIDCNLPGKKRQKKRPQKDPEEDI